MTASITNVRFKDVSSTEHFKSVITKKNPAHFEPGSLGHIKTVLMIATAIANVTKNQTNMLGFSGSLECVAGRAEEKGLYTPPTGDSHVS